MHYFPCPKLLKSLLLASKDKAAISKIHAFIISTGLSIHPSNITNAPLIASYARLGELPQARKVFDELPQRSVSAYNSMIIAYSRRNDPNEVLGVYDQMIGEGVRPDSSIFTVAVKTCVSLMEKEKGEAVWRKAVEFGYGNDVFVCSSVLNLYAKFGAMDEAAMVFDKMKRKDIVCWTAMVMGYVKSGQPLKAVGLYRKMQEEGVEGDGVVMLALIQACADIGDLKTGSSVHGHMIRRELPMDVVVKTSLIDMYAKNGLLKLASRVFEKMNHKNMVSWGALISGLTQNGFAGSALELLVEMQSLGFQPDQVSLVSALLACSQTGTLKMGKSIHGHILRRRDLDQVSATAVIDMYSKCGELSCSRALFDLINTKDLVSWNTMISCYGVHGNGQEALSVFLQMADMNIIPDHTTFTSLLSALSHSGLVEQGQYCFSLMVEKYNIDPSDKHYACMVDLLARAGLVDEALQLINSMNYEPGISIWVALLSGCINHSKLSIGEIAAKKILGLNPEDTGIHALVSNFFAMEKKWDEVAGVRKAMKGTGMKKVPGYSVIEVNRELHAFVMEDKSHSQYQNILCILDNLDFEMRASKTLDRFVP